MIGDGERRRRHLQGRGARGLSQPRSLHGVDRCRRQRRGRGGADVGGARRRRRATASKTSSARLSTGRICRDRAGRRSPSSSIPAANPIRTRRPGLRDALVFTGAAQVDEYLGVFLTDDRTPRKSVVTKKFCDNNPAIARSVRGGSPPHRSPDRAAPRGDDPRPHRRRCSHIATAAAANYRREKQERGLLDYDDLIDKTLAMLDRVSSGWVHYKLDRGVDHVLIDEAQDTSPRQWDIVAHIISEFTSGEGARDGVDAHDLRGRRREAVDLFVPGRGAARIRRPPPRAAAEVRRRRAEIRSGHPSPTRSVREPRSCNRSTTCFATRTIYRSIHVGRDRLSDPPFPRRRRAEPDRSLGTAAAGRTGRTSKAGARRSTACRRPARR